MPPKRKRTPTRKNKGNGRGRGGGGRRSAGRHIPTPFPWDGLLPANDKLINANCATLRPQVIAAALAGERPTEDVVRGWHRASLRGVRLAEPAISGGFRGEGPVGSQLRIYLNGVRGPLGVLLPGAPAGTVSGRVSSFFVELDKRLDALDTKVTACETLAAYYSHVLEVCAWAHGEWVRIHPFADHNGSTARLLVLSIGLRFGVPLPIPAKPRTAMPTPGLVVDYGLAAANQMLGDDQLMVTFLHRLAGSTAPPGGGTPPP